MMSAGSRVIKTSIITISIMIKEVPKAAMGKMATGSFHIQASCNYGN